MPLRRLVILNTKESLWLYVISVLKDKPLHAYALKREIEKRFDFRTGNMTVYKVLYLLSRNGYVSKKRQERKVIYTVTKKGTYALKEARKFYKNQVKRL